MTDKLSENIKKFSMDSLLIEKFDGEILVDYRSDEKVNARSISKTITSMGCGILIDKTEGDFNEETLVYPFLQDKVNIENKNNLKYLKKLRVKDCLTHTVGYRDMILMSKDIVDFDKEKLLEFALNYPIYFSPGQRFLYSNAGHFILACAMEEYLGYSFYDFMDENFFSKIGMKNIEWTRYGKYVAGSTKIYLDTIDLMKIGRVLANNGSYNGQTIVCDRWIKKMIKPRYKNIKEHQARHYLSDDFYGYGIWMGKDGIKYGSGLGGQYIILDEKTGIIIVTTNNGDLNKSHAIKNDIDYLINFYRGE